MKFPNNSIFPTSESKTIHDSFGTPIIEASIILNNLQYWCFSSGTNLLYPCLWFIYVHLFLICKIDDRHTKRIYFFDRVPCCLPYLPCCSCYKSKTAVQYHSKFRSLTLWTMQKMNDKRQTHKVTCKRKNYIFNRCTNSGSQKGKNICSRVRESTSGEVWSLDSQRKKATLQHNSQL